MVKSTMPRPWWFPRIEIAFRDKLIDILETRPELMDVSAQAPKSNSSPPPDSGHSLQSCAAKGYADSSKHVSSEDRSRHPSQSTPDISFREHGGQIPCCFGGLTVHEYPIPTRRSPGCKWVLREIKSRLAKAVKRATGR